MKKGHFLAVGNNSDEKSDDSISETLSCVQMTLATLIRICFCLFFLGGNLK
jgi:preprotein translocase subunit SecF